jgi:DNA-binding GntR family transcriptional regulator
VNPSKRVTLHQVAFVGLDVGYLVLAYEAVPAHERWRCDGRSPSRLFGVCLVRPERVVIPVGLGHVLEGVEIGPQIVRRNRVRLGNTDPGPQASDALIGDHPPASVPSLRHLYILFLAGERGRRPWQNGQNEYNIGMTANQPPEKGARREPGRTEPLVRKSSGEQVALHIRKLIFDGELRPGMRVPQDELARDLGVSRIPVREALIALEREGWVTVELHRGAFINAFNERAIRDNYDLFGLIYGFATERAIDRDGPELLKRLGAIETEFAKCEDAADLTRLFISFHSAIVDAAASPRINVVLRAMSALVPGNFFESVPEAISIEKNGLRAILRALRRSDGQKASAEYVRMMRRVGDQVVKLFKERGLLAAEAATA